MSEHHARQASTGSRFIEPENTTVKRLLAFFIDKHRQITEYRLQKLVFYADYAHYQEHGERITDLDYRAFMYGMYSQELRDTLEELECETDLDYLRGKVVDTYLEVTEDVDPSELDTEFLNEIHYETKDVQTEDLVEFTKSVPMFEKTDYEDVAEFNDRTVEDA